MKGRLPALGTLQCLLAVGPWAHVKTPWSHPWGCAIILVILCVNLKIGTPKEDWVNPEGGHMGHGQDWTDGRIFSEIVAPWFLRKLR